LKRLTLLLLLATGAFAADGPSDFLVGGDISMLLKYETLGARYSANGITDDALTLMQGQGANCFRLRLFVNPDDRNAVVQDLAYTVELARRIKHSGAALLLDIHYSDTWADPGHQTKPAAWRDLDFDDLTAEVETYTATVIQALKDDDALPDIVQIGNEITPGFLWPDGRIQAPQGGWDRFTTLLKAAIRGVQRPLAPGEEIQVMLHVDCGGDREATAWFFRNILAREVAFDLIGLSYYPWWHGSLADLAANVTATAETFGKDLMVVETAYPWRPNSDPAVDPWPRTPAGQAAFLKDVIGTMKATPNGRGVGVLWWSPESIPIGGLNVWMGGSNALFDAQGAALPALKVLGER